MIHLLAIGAFAILIARLVRRFQAPSNRIAIEDSNLREAFSLEIAPRLQPGTNFVGMATLVCVAYIGIAAGLIGNVTIALPCTAGSCFLLSWVKHEAGGKEKPSGRNNTVVLLLCIILASIVIFIAVPPKLGYPSAKPTLRVRKNRRNSSALDELQSGIILSVKRKDFMPLVFPHPNQLQKATKQLFSQPLRIPFSGDYWFLPWPHLQPPASSLRMRGDPTTLDVELQDFGALVMQARQNIGRSIATRCCHSIDVELHGTDPQPETVWMELILVDSSAAKYSSQSLGSQTLASARTVAGSDSTISSSTVRFAMPVRPAIQSFDSIIVWFHLGPPRTRDGATVAIEAFELNP